MTIEELRRELPADIVWLQPTRFETVKRLPGGCASNGVYTVRDRETDQIVVQKVFGQLGEINIGRTVSELSLLHSCQCQYVIKLRGLVLSDENNQTLSMITDYAPGGCLINAFRKLKSSQILSVARDVASALQIIHTRGVVHYDVKLDNIVLDSDQEHAALLDFGLAGRVDELREVAQPHFTAVHAPERSFGGSGVACDIWGLGVLLYELVKGCRMTGEERLALLENETKESTDGVVELIRRCLRFRPEERPALDEVVEALASAATLERSELEQAFPFLTGWKGSKSDASEFGRRLSKAKGGSIGDQIWVGRAYRSDRGDEPKDFVKALEWFERAAGAGSDWGMFQVARACDLGNGTRCDRKRALLYYERAGELGNLAALHNLCELKGKRLVESVSRAEGERWFCEQVALSFEVGWGVERDEKSAERWRLRASDGRGYDVEKGRDLKYHGVRETRGACGHTQREECCAYGV